VSTWWSRKRVTVTGGRGFLGTPLVRQLEEAGANVITFSSSEYNLTQQADVARMYRHQRPDIVFHLAARVGGIGANRDNPGSFFYENAIMGIEVMEQARQTGVSKFVQVGTVCAYPKFAPIPFSEDDLWNGYPEETNAPYGLAKKMLLVQAQAYRQQYGFNAIYLLPVNLYGAGRQHGPPQLTRHSCADPQVPGGETDWRAIGRGVGDGYPDPRIPLRRRRGSRPHARRRAL
jgi:GDP-L-fucose synthase